MDGKLEIKQKRSAAFDHSFPEIRLRLGMINGILILLTIGLAGSPLDNLISGGYLVLSILCYCWPLLRKSVLNSLNLPMVGLDLLVAAYAITRTGGMNSLLYSVLFIPIVIAAIRYNYLGILVWSGLMSFVLASAAVIDGKLLIIPLLIKIAYLFLTGTVCGFLVQQTFMATEEVSRDLERWSNDLERLNHYSLEVTGSSTIDEIFEQTLKTVRQTRIPSMAAIMLFDENDILKFYNAFGWENDWVSLYNNHHLSRSNLILASILVFKKPVICPDIRKQQELMKPSPVSR
jgi:glucose-6-phosphate-specific signal transduction histidine kinase